MTRRHRALVCALLVGAATSTACATAPGGAAQGPSPWKVVFRDDFSRSLDLGSWGRYSGQPGGDPGGWWDPSHVVVRGGRLRLETYRDPRFGNRWVSGGLSSSHAVRQRYGRYDVRFRMDRGVGVAGIALLWPVRDVWPPEIDFAETGGIRHRRDEISATLHYGADNDQLQRTLSVDVSRWHVMGVRWTPGQLVYTIDGRAWSVIRSPDVPAERMELDLQTQAGTCGDRWAPCPDATTPAKVAMEVDWVRIYAYRPARGT
jgi:beta-glucanase (GH16 family)